MNTLSYMFWGYLAGFALVAAYVAWLGTRLSALERRLARLGELLAARDD
ncbi:MAG: hypothetical protein Kow0062_15600 [Acidobacteriota bacterium]